MRKNLRASRKAAGFTLITTLAFSLIVATVLAGVGTVAVSHYSRSHTEGDYANSIALADAGINHEINYISKNVTNGIFGVNVAHQAGSPDVGQICISGSCVPGNYSVFAEKSDGTQWLGIGDVIVVATGTVNGISRTVQVRGRGESFFNDYSIYALGGATFNGLGASDKDGIQGNMGSNDTVTLHGSLGSAGIAGTLYMNGPNATSPGPGGNVVHNPNPVNFPTVDQVANGLFPGGLTYLQTHNNNANIKMLKAADPTLATEPTIAGITMADVNSKLTTAGFTTASRTLSVSPLTVPVDTSTLDASSTGTRFVNADGASVQGVKGDKVYFLPPGDYYFSDLSSNVDLVMLTHLGPVRIWVDSATSGSASFSGLTTIFTDTTASTFRVYWNKCGSISMHGHAVFHGSIYAVKNGCKSGDPSIDMAGGNHWYGSVIANSFTISGGSKIIFPNNNGTGDDPAPWFGFKNDWKEVGIGSNPVFVDGTSN